MRHGCASDTQADLSLRALYTYLTSLVMRLLVRVFTVQYNNLFSHTTKTVTSWADAQTAQIVSYCLGFASIVKDMHVLCRRVLATV